MSTTVRAALYPKNAVVIRLIGDPKGRRVSGRKRFSMNIDDLSKKAESGSVVAQTILGICFLDGIGVEVDYGEAFRLLSHAANKGAMRAQSNLGRMYAEGLGIPKNLSTAVSLYECAAEAGEFFAQISLGRLYSEGDGIEPNPVAARKWYLEAIKQEDRVGDCDELDEARSYLDKTT